MKYSGIVQKGNGTGRTYGFPTANIPLADESLSGIYAGMVRFDGAEHRAAVYADTRRKLLEAHLLGFEGEIYGKEIEIELTDKIRDDRQFADESEAIRTIRSDIEAAEAYFHRVN